jgi:hypothetical protein
LSTSLKNEFDVRALTAEPAGAKAQVAAEASWMAEWSPGGSSVEVHPKLNAIKIHRRPSILI